jgi:hypothetical protein
MTEHKQILGYARLPDDSWEPIEPCKNGYIYTQAFISCVKCNRFIRDMGGPLSDSLCVDCFKTISPGYKP